VLQSNGVLDPRYQNIVRNVVQLVFGVLKTDNSKPEDLEKLFPHRDALRKTFVE